MKRIYTCTLFVWCFLLAETGLAQPRTAGEWAWKPILDHAGVSFSYIFYQHADNHHNGVVLKLVNTNDYDVTYRFKIIFRSEGEAVVEPVAGSLRAKEIKTGDAAGLFWIPFKDGREIAEVGLRGYKVVPKESSGPRAAQNDDP